AQKCSHLRLPKANEATYGTETRSTATRSSSTLAKPCRLLLERKPMSNTTIVAGRIPIPAPAMVTTDQATVLGNGTQSDPIRAASTPNTFDATFIPDLPNDPKLGMVVALLDETPEPGTLASVKPADAGVDGAPQAVGLITSIRGASPPIVTVQTS